MKQQRIRAWITFLIAFAMLFSFGSSYRSTAENSMPAAGEKTYSNVTESSQSLSLSDQCSILNYVDEKEFMANGFTKRVLDEEDLNTYIFEREDGTRGLYMFGEDVKFEDASGNVLEKDISLEKTYGGYTTKQNNVGLLLPDHLSDGIKMSFAEKTLTVYIADDNAVKSEKNGNSIKYINAYGDNAHLVLTPTLSGVKQDIVLDHYTWENQFDIIITSDFLEPFYDEEGKLYFAETEFDEYRFNVGSLFVYDSAGHFTGGKTEIDQVAENEWLMTLIVPQEFLASDNTIYPVTIDPKIEIKSENDSSFIEDTTVYSGKPNLATGTWSYNHTGYLSDGYNIGRMLVRTPGLYNNSTFSSIQTSQICSAKFFIKETSGSAAQEVKLYAYTGTSWSENTATWNNTSPNGSYTLIDTQYPAYGAYTEYNVTNLVKGWKNGTYTASLGFMLKSTNESNVNNAKAFDASESAYSSVQPYIVVTYRPLIFLQYYSLNLNEGESCSNLAITNPTTTVQWSSSDPSVATVSSSGVITGIRASATPVTITATALDPYCPASATCTVYVKIPDGSYYLRNKETGLYAEPTGYLEGNEVYQWTFGGTYTQRWTIEYLSNGVYRIKNQMSDLYLAIESLYSTSAKATQYSTASDLSRWYISRSSSGAFCLYAKGNLSSGYVIGSALSGNTNGTSIKNMLYSSDTNYKDEWFIELDVISISSRLPNEDAQNKENWCWAACSKKVGEENGVDGALTKIPKLLTTTSHVHSYGGNLFYGETFTGELTADGGQWEIVMNIFGDDDDHPGTISNIETALQLSSYNFMNIGTIGPGTLTTSDIEAINDELLSGRWVVGDLNGGSIGHCIVIQNYNPLTQAYIFWDPWTNSNGFFTKTQLINSTIHIAPSTVDRALFGVQYCH